MRGGLFPLFHLYSSVTDTGFGSAGFLQFMNKLEPSCCVAFDEAQQHMIDFSQCMLHATHGASKASMRCVKLGKSVRKIRKFFKNSVFLINPCFCSSNDNFELKNEGFNDSQCTVLITSIYSLPLREIMP